MVDPIAAGDLRNVHCLGHRYRIEHARQRFATDVDFYRGSNEKAIVVRKYLLYLVEDWEQSVFDLVDLANYRNAVFP
jgi:hypothetical protein